MKNLTLLAVALLIAASGFSQCITLNVKNDLTINGTDTLFFEGEYTSIDVCLGLRRGVYKMKFNNEAAGTFQVFKFKILAMDIENEDSFIMENEYFGRVRFTHDVMAFVAKIEFKKDNRVIELN